MQLIRSSMGTKWDVFILGCGSLLAVFLLVLSPPSSQALLPLSSATTNRGRPLSRPPSLPAFLPAPHQLHPHNPHFPHFHLHPHGSPAEDEEERREGGVGRKGGKATRRGGALFMARDLIDVKGLPKANIMRTNSSAAFVMEQEARIKSSPSLDDLGRSLEDVMSELLHDVGFKERMMAMASTLPLPAAGVLSSAALIAGCMIGAGVLALPSVTVHTGIVPSSIAILSVWAYCAASGLLIGEVCINSKGSSAHASYLKIAGATVGKGLASSAFGVFTIFQYFLLAAYISQGGALLDGFVHLLPGLHDLITLPPSLPPSLPPLAAFTAAMAALFVGANQRILANFNNVVVMVVVVCFAVLLFAGTTTVDPSLYNHMDFGALQDVVPVAMCALVFQNVVPVVAANLNFDRAKVMSAILLGSGMPAFMYLTWNAMILGNVHLESLGEHGLDLYSLLGGGDSAVGVTLRVFSLGAIATSFIGCILSIVEEFAEFGRSFQTPAPARPPSFPSSLPPSSLEGEENAIALLAAATHYPPLLPSLPPSLLKEEAEAAGAAAGAEAVRETSLSASTTQEENEGANNLPMLALILLPPLLFATLYPDGFLGAIETSGGFGDPFLFGILPVVMAWRQRYSGPQPGKNAEGGDLVEPLVPGGKWGLLGLGAFAGAMLLNKGIDTAPDVLALWQQGVEVASQSWGGVAPA